MDQSHFFFYSSRNKSNQKSNTQRKNNKFGHKFQRLTDKTKKRHIRPIGFTRKRPQDCCSSSNLLGFAQYSKIDNDVLMQNHMQNNVSSSNKQHACVRFEFSRNHFFFVSIHSFLYLKYVPLAIQYVPHRDCEGPTGPFSHPRPSITTISSVCSYFTASIHHVAPAYITRPHFDVEKVQRKRENAP